MITPFRQNLGVFFENCLTPFIKVNYAPNGEVSLQRGDQIRRPGVIMCKGICKRIQESDFVVADVSVPNANVFYELGLAYGIGQRIIVVYHKDPTPGAFGAAMADYLRDDGCKALGYHDLDPILREDFVLSLHLWTRKHTADARGQSAQPQTMFLYEHYLAPPTQVGPPAADDPPDIPLSFSTHVRSGVGLAIEHIHSRLKSEQALAPRAEVSEPILTYLSEVDCTRRESCIERLHAHFERPYGKVIADYLDDVYRLKEFESAKPNARFPEVLNLVERAYCMVVRTGGKTCHPMAYFWLGYGHARGKNVIPIAEIDQPRDRIEDLAFDIHAQRHMTFIRKAPERLRWELEETLHDMVVTDFAERSRKGFWDQVLGKRGEVSIFTGALHIDAFDREMIGDWDLRTASELTTYFGQHQYRAKIESPVYEPRHVGTADTTVDPDYIPTLRKMMENKNCILVASPDVNPLTEIVLGTTYRVDEALWFAQPADVRTFPDAIVALKEKTAKGPSGAPPPSGPRRALYTQLLTTDSNPGRGFMSSKIRGNKLLKPFISQVDRAGGFVVYAHLAILKNPFPQVGSVPMGADGNHRYIIVLNGVSGPATFALTHVLTGGGSQEFVSYQEGFDPEAESEKILRGILTKLDYSSSARGVECIIEVTVGPPWGTEEERGRNADKAEIFDWRRILCWRLAEENALDPPIRVLQ